MLGYFSINSLSFMFGFQPDRVPWLPPSLHGRSDTLTLLTTAHVFEKLGPLMVNKECIILLLTVLGICSQHLVWFGFLSERQVYPHMHVIGFIKCSLFTVCFNQM